MVFKEQTRKELMIYPKKNEVRVGAPDPQAFWAEIQTAGGIEVSDGQVLKIKLDVGQKYAYNFDRQGDLVAVDAPEAIVLVTATDASGNTGTATASASAAMDGDGEDDDDKDDGGKGREKQVPPEEHALFQNVPNPFNPETTIEYALREEAHVRLVIYNAMGQMVRTLVDAVQVSGYHQVVWDSRDAQGQLVSGGVYFCRMTASGFSETRRMVLLR